MGLLRWIVTSLVVLTPVFACADTSFYSADLHVHTSACGGRTLTPKQLVKRLEKENINLGVLLLYGNQIKRPPPDLDNAIASASTSTTILHKETEVAGVPGSAGGHLTVLGTTDFNGLADVVHQHRSGIALMQWAQQYPDMLIGVAHAQHWPEEGFPKPTISHSLPLETPVLAALGQLKFLSTEINGGSNVLSTGTWTLWQKLLNSGFRIPLTAGSDVGCLNLKYGEIRTLYPNRGEISYLDFLDALRHGRTAFTRNDNYRLWLHSKGAQVGDEIKVKSGEPFTIDVEMQGSRIETVELLVNGKALPAFYIDPKQSTYYSVELKLSESAWIVARNHFSHTSPMYVVVDDKPIRPSKQDACYFIRYVDYLKKIVSNGVLNLGQDKALALTAYDRARKVFETHFKQAGGIECS